MNEDYQFYPTPKELARKMVYLSKGKVNCVLEPSAGEGHIIDELTSSSMYAPKSVDAIELSSELSTKLTAKGIRVIHNDFLTFDSYKRYSHIYMNPPFSAADKHLLKAIELQERYGGQVIAIVGSNVVNNVNSNIRKTIMQKLDMYEADIEIIQDAFLDADRKTKVEIALISIVIPERKRTSFIIDDLKKKEEYQKSIKEDTGIIKANFIEGIIEQYNFEVKAGIKLIEEYEAMSPFILNSFGERKFSILTLSIEGLNEYEVGDIRNSFIKKVRRKYWETLFNSKDFHKMLTSSAKEDMYAQIDELTEYDFSEYNVKQLKLKMISKISGNMQDTIENIFEYMSQKHSQDNFSKNVHLFNGWKTNKSWKINDKVIVPINGYDWYDKNKLRLSTSSSEKLRDIELAISYLESESFDDRAFRAIVDNVYDMQQNKNVQFKYFKVTFYKKGTCHIEFTNKEALKRLNIFACKNKNWLPPSYSKASYTEMAQDDKEVIDSFEGEESYLVSKDLDVGIMPALIA